MNSKETSLIKSKILVTIALIQSCFSMKTGVYKYINILLLADINKCQRKLKVQSRMDKPETLTTLGTQDTRRWQTKHKNTITQKTKKMSNTDTTQNMKIKIKRISFKFRFLDRKKYIFSLD